MRNYTKRLKDGDEQRHSPTSTVVSCYPQVQHTGLRFGSISRSFQVLCFRFHTNAVSMVSHLAAQYPRLPCQIQINRQLVRIIVTSVFTLIFLGILVSRIA
uniref:Uncharacterized protein n=1 Tax=Rhizophora mucronata TaxID=61149 RepID=A0A2P2LCG0_RHIMU